MFRVRKEAFAIIGKEGSTAEGEGFIQKLWQEANSHFEEIAHLAKRGPGGELVGIWGAMTDFSRAFRPWEDGFRQGLYLAGVECADQAEAPAGWTKWTIPGYEYLAVENRAGAFGETLGRLGEQGLSLAGAVHEYTDPATGKEYLYFPIRRLPPE